MTTATHADPLAPFSEPTRTWFREAFAAPTRAQELGWDAISGGKHALIHAPTGSGKTLAAFLWCLDRLMAEPARAKPTVRVLYVSPLKALTYDVERNLRTPLAGIRRTAERLGQELPEISVASRTGDTPADARRALVRHPPDILVTTPESLYLLLTSQAREILRGVEHVIVDEVHAIAATKRGSHLALSLERLSHLADADPQRIGLSATQRPLSAIAAFLGGTDRDVEIVDAGARKELDLEIVVPVEDMARMGEAMELDEAPGGPAAGPEAKHSIWPSIHPRLLELIRAHRSTLIFVNSRRLAERLAARLNELAGEELVRAHHGSVAREQRLQIEEDLKQGRLPALVATSSLELGIDMGAIDLVVQIEAPPSVASGMQRIGRAGHSVGEPSVGKIFPKYRGDLVEAAVVVERMKAAAIEETRIPRHPLDVLAQQLVAICAFDRWTVSDLHRLVTRAESFRDLSREQLEGVLDMLSGRYPSDEFADLKPRVVWDRQTDEVTSRNDARVVAITSGGTIPDRGLFGVFLPGDDAGRGGRRVGELDEEMVYESRVGETFLLGASTWRIEEIRPDRVIVTPAPGEPGKMPFWHGDAIGRPIELGRAIGSFLRELEPMKPADAVARLRDAHAMDELAAKNLVAYLGDQVQVTGVLPTDRTIVVERFRDELGDWRVVLLTPFGGRVHAPWSMAIEARLREQHGLEVQSIWSDDGIAVRLPEGVESDGSTIEGALLFEPDEIEDRLMADLGSSALFAARFRENAARALLLPRRRPGQRTPLWMQRQRSADLLAVASQYGSFPIILETYREVLRDVFDMPALRDLLADVRARRIRVVSVESRSASPFACSLLFDYVGSFMYEGDAPLAERRAQALALDRELLAELLGSEELRELIDPEAVADLELELQALAPNRQARTLDGVADLLRRLGDLRTDEVEPRESMALTRRRRWRSWRGRGARCGSGSAARSAGSRSRTRPAIATRSALRPRRALQTRSSRRWIARSTCCLRAGRGRTRHSPPTRRRRAGASPATPSRIGCERWLRRASCSRARSAPAVRRTSSPIPTSCASCVAGPSPACAARSSRSSPTCSPASSRPGRGSARRPAASGASSRPSRSSRACRCRRRCSSATCSRRGSPATRRGCSTSSARPARWCGSGAAHSAATTAEWRCSGAIASTCWPQPGSVDERPSGPIHDAVRQHLQRRGASFFPQLRAAGADARNDEELLDALWDLVWAGEVTNDTFAPLRALSLPRSRSKARPRPGRLTALGPPRAAGRWSLVADLVGEERSPTERGHALATALLERHGVVTREAVVAEGIAGGYASVYPVLRAMEESGRARRGYFVAGLGAAQFALPGAVDRLRAIRDDEPTVRVLAATDPAQPYGAALPWPRGADDERLPLQRAAGAYVVLVDGLAVLYLERGGRSLVSLPAASDPERRDRAVAALPSLVAPAGPMRELRIERVDRGPVAESALADALREVGFRPSYRGFVLGRP